MLHCNDSLVISFFMIRFWPKVISLSIDATYSQRQLVCTYEYRYLALALCAYPCMFGSLRQTTLWYMSHTGGPARAQPTRHVWAPLEDEPAIQGTRDRILKAPAGWMQSGSLASNQPGAFGTLSLVSWMANSSSGGSTPGRFVGPQLDPLVRLMYEMPSQPTCHVYVIYCKILWAKL